MKMLCTDTINIQPFYLSLSSGVFQLFWFHPLPFGVWSENNSSFDTTAPKDTFYMKNKTHILPATATVLYKTNIKSTHIHMFSFICYSIKSYLLLFYFFLCLTQLQLGCWIYHLNYFCKANKRISRLLSLFLQFLRYLIYIYMYVFVSFVKP